MKLIVPRDSRTANVHSDERRDSASAKVGEKGRNSAAASATLGHKLDPVGQPNPLGGLQLPRTKSMWGFATSRKLTVFRRFAAPYSFSSPLLA